MPCAAPAKLGFNYSNLSYIGRISHRRTVWICGDRSIRGTHTPGLRKKGGGKQKYVYAKRSARRNLQHREIVIDEGLIPIVEASLLSFRGAAFAPKSSGVPASVAVAGHESAPLLASFH